VTVAPLLKLSGITKWYGDLLASDAVDLTVAPGEVVAMLGENGAGKSTLMKVVYGLIRPDAGTVAVDGRVVDIASPRDAMSVGIGMVTQEFSLVDTMTVAENVTLSTVGFGRVDASRNRAQVLAAMDRIGVHIEPDRLVSTLSIGERQRVEIVKALFHDCRVLILDEPTAVLTPQDVRSLFSTIERLRADGLGVLFVSHKLREVAEISNRVVVLRRGRVVGERVTAAVHAEELAGLMMGTVSEVPAGGETVAAAVGLAPVAELGATTDADAEEPGTRPSGVAHGAAVVLELTDVSVAGSARSTVHEVSLAVHAGEIVGLAGISGNGQTELMDGLVGTRKVTGGQIRVDGTDITHLPVTDRLAAGLGRLTEDRKGSLVPQMSVEHNLALEDLGSFSRGGRLDRRAIRARAEELIERFAIRATPTDPVASLSGGNMQKVLLARALARKPRALVVAHPTRGLDIGAYRYVHSQLQEMRDEGAAVLVISEDLDELHILCDRIGVLFRGSLVGVVDAADAGPERLGAMMTGEVVPA
jgi:simple sugar transport system ATP-binding protein